MYRIKLLRETTWEGGSGRPDDIRDVAESVGVRLIDENAAMLIQDLARGPIEERSAPAEEDPSAEKPRKGTRR